MPEPPDDDGPVLVQTQAIGICGTDLEIINGQYGSAPPGQDRLIIGHESLGKVVQAAPGTGFRAGDLVVGIVRRRDPVPCPARAVGDWDMCTNGRYTAASAPPTSTAEISSKRPRRPTSSSSAPAMCRCSLRQAHGMSATE
jgi:threonine dehydrogenase-like Zn-dependent dehydrogenase